MSIESVDTFEPSSSTPVFGGEVSQTKLQQQQPSKDVEESEKLVTPSVAVVNGQTDSTKNKTSGNTAESAQEHPRKNGTTDEHVNEQNKSATVDTIPLVESPSDDNPAGEFNATSGASDSVDKSSQKESTSVLADEQKINVAPPAVSPTNDVSAPTEPETALSISVDEVKEDVSSTATTNVEHAPPTGPSVATTSEDTSPVAASTAETIVHVDSASSEPKTPRGKAKSPVISTPPTRQSTRARKPVTSTNKDETETTEDITPTKTNQKPPTSTRGKRQAATTPKDTKQTTPTAGSSSTEKVQNKPEKETVRSDVEDHGDSAKDKTKTPTLRKGTRTTPVSTVQKREASPSPSPSPSPSVSKKQKATPKGRKYTTKDDNEKMDVVNEKGNKAVTTIETENPQTPPKKPRTSANKTTPTSKTPESNEEYMRKLRPRK